MNEILFTNPFPWILSLKSNKNIKIGYNTYYLSLAHSDISGYNVCPMANKLKANENNKNKSSCSLVCVGYQGLAKIFKSVMKARIRKTKMFYEDREQFFNLSLVCSTSYNNPSFLAVVPLP